MRRYDFIALLCATALSSWAADNSFLGKWELNLAKSKLNANPPIQAQTIEYSMDGSNVKASVTVNGKPMNPMMYDGQEHAASTTSPVAYTHAIGMQRGKTLQTVFKRDGKEVGTRKNTVSEDGRTMTVISDGKSPDGKSIRSVAIFDKRE